MAISLIRNFIAKQIFKQKGAIANNKAVEFSANALEDRLKNLGIDPNLITSEKELNQILGLVKQAEDRAFQQRFGDMLNRAGDINKRGEVFDLTGKKIDPRSKIMGGQQAETEAEIAARMSKQNKEAAQRIKNKKMLDDAIDNVSPGFSGDRKVDAELVAEDLAERMGKSYDDLPTKERLDLYDQAFQGLTKKKFDPQDFATGGRAEFKSGGITALKALLNFFAKQRGTKGSQQLKEINPKSVPRGIMNIMGPKEKKMLEKNQTDYIEALLGTIKSDKKFLDNKKRIAKQIQKDIDESGFGDFTNAEKMMKPFIESAMKGDRLDRMRVYDKINVDDAIIDIEQMIKNRRMKESDGRALNATGGRIGLKDGMTRRTFLKLLGGMAAIPIVGKFLKPLKTAKGVKKVPMIATDNVPGKPEWFDALVNKVILEGDDVTKNFATAERQSIHQKTLNDGSVVRVTEDVDDGAVRVEYESVDNMYEDPVQMQYKKPLPDEGDPRPSAEFEVAESGPVGRSVGPDDYDIDIDEVGGQSISDLTSDVSKLKEYATGQKPTLKEFVQSKKRKDKAKAISEGGEAEADEVTRRQGDFIQFEDIDPDPGDFARGGIARMLGE